MVINSTTEIALDPVREHTKVKAMENLPGWVKEERGTTAVVFWKKDTAVVEDDDGGDMG